MFSIDSHHKLIRWRLVTHGGIDGFSRLIVYLRCSSNNQSATVYQAFLEAARMYDIPSRICSDQGTENVKVAQYMIEKCGAERRSFITGCSVHNQRIERLWHDMHRGVTVLYYKLFYFMEQQNMLDHLNEHHLWALLYVFLPRINRGLKEFVNSWNNHPIRTANHKSLQQLYTAGALLLQHSGLAAMDFFASADEDYGVDPNGPNAEDGGDHSGITIPQTTLKFSEADNSLLRQNVDPLAPSLNYGIELYEQTLTLISTFTPL